jgi:hypothetical protein
MAISKTTDGSIEYIRSFLYGEDIESESGNEAHMSTRQSIHKNATIEQALKELDITLVEGIANLTQENLTQCIDVNKPIVILEGSNV